MENLQRTPGISCSLVLKCYISISICIALSSKKKKKKLKLLFEFPAKLRGKHRFPICVPSRILTPSPECVSVAGDSFSLFQF